MLLRRTFCFCWVYFVFSVGQIIVAQKNTDIKDTLFGQNDEVVVTATRTQRKLSNIAVPVLLINGAEIQASQLRRLNELVQEQTGLVITNGSGTSGFGGGIFGNGVQLQGMNPDYTLILLNGEPIIGRQGGSINLARLTLGNIRKIEIIKGPASSLYGSEAMGGVINIITEVPNQSGASAAVKVGGYGLFDGTLSGNTASRNTKATFSYNHYRLGAIDHQPTVYGNQQDPFNNHTFQAQLSHQFSARLRLMSYARYFSEKAANRYQAPGANASTDTVFGFSKVNDVNINHSLQWLLGKSSSTTWRLYGTGYESKQLLTLQKNGSTYYDDRFAQQFYRIENQTDIHLNAQNTLTNGGGFVYEHLRTTRYAGTRSNQIAYGFVQHEWKPKENINIITGIRYDYNKEYASRLSPKLAIRFSPTTKWKLTASYGEGFKAPDFRQLYLNFTNNASAGYTLFGANEISYHALLRMQQQGSISTLLNRAADLAPLLPETSKGINIGTTYDFSKNWHAELNFFNNDLANQIVFDVIALQPNGAQVFSYFNVNKSFTKGGEINVKWKAASIMTITTGYQLLFTGDKAIMEQLNEGKIFGRDLATGRVSVLKKADYAGLPGRSRHMAHIKWWFQHPKGWQASMRAVYRNGWGTFDQDGNGIINRKDEMAEGYVLLNVNVSRQINPHLQVGIGGENLLNHTDPNNLPSLAGANGFIAVSWRIF